MTSGFLSLRTCFYNDYHLLLYSLVFWIRPRGKVHIYKFYQYFYSMIYKENLWLFTFSSIVFKIIFLFEFSSQMFFTCPIKFVWSICSVLPWSILLLSLYNSSMMKFLMAITSAVKLDVDFVILSKLRSTFEKVSLVGVLHSLFLVLCRKVPHHFQFRFDCPWLLV